MPSKLITNIMLSRLGDLGVCRAGPEDSSLALVLLQLAFWAAAAPATIAAIDAAIASLLQHCSLPHDEAYCSGTALILLLLCSTTDTA